MTLSDGDIRLVNHAALSHRIPYKAAHRFFLITGGSEALICLGCRLVSAGYEMESAERIVMYNFSKWGTNEKTNSARTGTARSNQRTNGKRDSSPSPVSGHPEDNHNK